MRRFKVGDEIIAKYTTYIRQGIITELYREGQGYDYVIDDDIAVYDHECTLIKKESEYPTYDLSIEHYNLSPKSPALVPEIGTLVEFKLPYGHYVLGTIESSDRIRGFHNGDSYKLDLNFIKTDTMLIKNLKEYFNQVKQ